ncbi:MAG: hypothetical protein HY286_07235 [Planctomycetes bacterium]|nr:hypothetical protein [Planctomycetota bacterium]
MPFTIALLAAFACPPAQTPAPAPAATPPAVHFAKARLVEAGWPDLSTIVLLADLDNDKFGDLISINLNDRGNIEFARNVRGGKFGAGAIGAAMPEGTKLEPLQEVAIRRAEGKRPELLLKRADGVIVHFQVPESGPCTITTELPASRPAATSASQEAASQPAAGQAPANVNINNDRVLWTKGDARMLGDFDGDGKIDEIVDSKLMLAAGGPPIDVPFLRELPPHPKIVVGDFQGDKKDDILVLRNDDAWRVGRDVNIYLSYLDADTDWDGDGLDNKTEEQLKTDPLDADTDHDGLLDGWEVRGEGSVDLPLFGASPTHKDCVVYLQRYDNTNPTGVKNDIARAVDYWSKLPVKNPDGQAGIHLIPIWLGPLPAAGGGRPWWELGEENLPIPARGIAHYMEINGGGGGQSSELGDKGGCGEGALYATFLHEFGHQVGLSHAGGPLPGMCPTYSSLMNYAYSYGFNDDYNQIHYSSGDLSALILNKAKLRERVDVPYDKIKFLAKGPWNLKLKADGAGTWVDWNRNGQFDEGVVRADISDTYGVDGGVRHPAGKTIFAPALATHKDDLYLFGVTREKKLFIKKNLDEGKWDAEIPLPQVEPAGDPWTISDGAKLYCFIPVKDGVAAMSAADAKDFPAAPAAVLPGSEGCQISACMFQKRLIVLLWHSKDEPVRFTELDADGKFINPKEMTGVDSYNCPSAVEDVNKGNLLLATTYVGKENNAEKRRWRLLRAARAADGAFSVVNKTWVGGENSGWVGNTRPIILFDSGADMGPNGRIHIMSVGWTDPPNHNGCFYEAISIGDASQNDGWRLRRFYDEWTTSRSPIGACWYKNDIMLGFRWFGNVHGDDDDNLLVSHHALGITDADMRDFDDVTEIAECGLAHSIPWRMGTVK